TLARSGEEALALLRAAARQGHAFDVALVDHIMPGLDGLALARAAKADPLLAATPLLLLTSYLQRGSREEGLRHGFATVLSKPVRHAHLLAALVDARTSARPAAPPASQAAPPPIGGDGAPAWRGHLLLVEDNVVNQKVAVHHLERLGYTCDVANDG